jgi:hypothetical protein
MTFRQTFDAKEGDVRGAIIASTPVVVLVNYTIPAGVVVNDVTEFGAIPHGCRVTDAVVYTDGLGASCTVDVGVVSGTYGKDDQARTVGNEFHAGANVAAAGIPARATKNTLAVAAQEYAQGFGVKFLGANPTAGKVLTVALTCMSK